MTNLSDEIPNGWEWIGIRWCVESQHDVPMYIFKNTLSGDLKEFSGSRFTPRVGIESRKKAVAKLIKYTNIGVKS